MVRETQVVHKPELSEWLGVCVYVYTSGGDEQTAQPPTKPTGPDDVVGAGSVPSNNGSPSTGPQLAAPGLY